MSEKQKQYLSRSYRTRQAESFEYLETKASEWSACEIKAINQATNEKEFDTKGYAVVTPITDRTPADQLMELQSAMQEKEYAETLCELCGAPIKTPHPIIHHGKKLVMFIGSECVTNYTEAGPEYKEKTKQFKANYMRQKFRLWASIIKPEIRMKGKRKTDPGLLYPDYYFLLKKINAAVNDLENQKTVSLRAIFRRAYRLGITIPPDYIPKK